MDFEAQLYDPTDTADAPIAAHCTIYGFAVNRDTANVLLFVRGWRSEAACKAGRQPILDTQLTFSDKDYGQEIVARILAADWSGVAALARLKLQPA